MVVVMAVVTSLAAPFALRAILRRIEPGADEAARLRREETSSGSLVGSIRRILVPVRPRQSTPRRRPGHRGDPDRPAGHHARRRHHPPVGRNPRRSGPGQRFPRRGGTSLRTEHRGEPADHRIVEPGAGGDHRGGAGLRPGGARRHRDGLDRRSSLWRSRRRDRAPGTGLVADREGRSHPARLAAAADRPADRRNAWPRDGPPSLRLPSSNPTGW